MKKSLMAAERLPAQSFAKGISRRRPPRPASAASGRATPHAPPQTPALLLVEDEISLRELLAEVIGDSGYRVVVAGDADRAIDLIERGGSRFAAVLTDIRLGGLRSGWDIGRCARRCDAGVGLIYFSADSGCDWVTQGEEGSLFLQKPFTLARLLDSIATVLRPTDLGAPSSGGA